MVLCSCYVNKSIYHFNKSISQYDFAAYAPDEILNSYRTISQRIEAQNRCLWFAIALKLGSLGNAVYMHQITGQSFLS